MCDCIDKMEDLIKKKNSEAVFSNLSFTMGGEPVLPPLEFQYYEILKNGKRSSRLKKEYILYSYCPFCGIKYKTESADKRN